MDDHKRRKLEKKSKNKRRYEDDAAAPQNRSEKKAKKLLHLQNQDARTLEDPAEKTLSKKKTKRKGEKKKHSALKLEELRNHHLEDESLHKRDATEHKEDRDMHEGDLDRDINEEREIKKKKKKKKRENMDVDVSLGRGIQEQEQQEDDQHTLEETLNTENINGEKKRSKKKKDKKEEHEEDEHSEKGNLLKKNKKEEDKRSNKKEEKKREGKEQKAESPSQKMLTQFSGENHEHREEKKVRSLAKENGMGEVGSNGSVKEDESASSKPRKHSKVSRKTVERVNYDPASNEEHNLLDNNIECSQRSLADQFQHVINTSMTIDSHSKEKEKGKKKEQKRKRVSFQDQINETDQQRVRDIPNAASENSMEIAEEVWGVRFTTDEDAILKDAIWNYIKSKGWDEQEGLNKVFNSNKFKDARNCWADINLALPHRPRQAIRYRAHLLLEKGAHAGKWSEEEEQLLRRLQGEHGRKWKEISALIDRHRTSIKEKWRSLKRMKAKGGWTQGELQQLSDLVHKCLRAKALIPVDKRKPDRHILRDDINWEKIADTIGTHNHGSCCGKWYYNLQSSLVTDGLWANEDDLLLLESLLESGACVEEEVEWDSLLNHRSGQVCLTRWKQMVKQLGENRTRQFLDKLDILARRYAPELLESSVKEMSLENSNIKENPSGSAKISDS